MATWHQFSEEAPELANAVRARFEAAKHHVLTTLRRDGSPRVSGTEVEFRGRELVVGSMYGAVKARDLQRDGRFALHANPGDGSIEGGDAKVAGVAIEAHDEGDVAGPENGQPPARSHAFRLELTEAVLTWVHPAGDRLLHSDVASGWRRAAARAHLTTRAPPTPGDTVLSWAHSGVGPDTAVRSRTPVPLPLTVSTSPTSKGRARCNAAATPFALDCCRDVQKAPSRPPSSDGERTAVARPVSVWIEHSKR